MKIMHHLTLRLCLKLCPTVWTPAVLHRQTAQDAHGEEKDRTEDSTAGEIVLQHPNSANRTSTDDDNFLRNDHRGRRRAGTTSGTCCLTQWHNNTRLERNFHSAALHGTVIWQRLHRRRGSTRIWVILLLRVRRGRCDGHDRWSVLANWLAILGHDFVIRRRVTGVCHLDWEPFPGGPRAN